MKLICHVASSEPRRSWVMSPLLPGMGSVREGLPGIGRSEKAEKFLVVSNKPMDIPGCKDPITIVESNFKPDRLPSQKEILELIESDEYRKRKPKGWDKPDPIEKDFYQIYFERYGATDSFDFEKLLKYHSANHANFLNPKFFIILNESKVPLFHRG